MRRDGFNYWTSPRSSRFSRRRALQAGGLIGAGAAGFALVGCGDDDDAVPSPTDDDARPTRAPDDDQVDAEPTGRLSVALGLNPIPTSFNPLYYTSGNQLPYLNHVSDTLTFWHEENGTTVFAPQLAETVERAEDGLSWTYTLHQNAEFHNGDPVTAEEVKFTWDTFLEAPHSDLPGARKTELQRAIASVETPDEHTVVFHLNEPYVLDNLIDVRYVSRRVWEEVGLEGYGRNPVSCGPFEFASGELGDWVEFRAVRGHYRKTPNVETVRLAYVSEAGTRIAQLETGEADIIEVPVPLVEEARRIPNARVLKVEHTNLNFLSFDGMRQGRFDMPWADPRVRQALSYAIDRDGITQALFAGGEGATPHGSFSLAYAHGYVEIPPDPYDPETARALLTEAGYGDGFEIPFMSSATPEWALAIQSQWRDIGVEMVFDILDPTAHFARLQEHRLFGVTPRGVGIYKPDPSGWGLFTFTDAFYGSFYEDWYDEQMQIASSHPDDQVRYEAWAEIQRRNADERIHISLWADNHFFGLHDRVAWYEPFPSTYYINRLEDAQLA